VSDIIVETKCTVYCCNGPHSGNMREAYMTLTKFKEWLRGSGWALTKDGWLCPDCKRSRKR
jgi:hypothetical protein